MPVTTHVRAVKTPDIAPDDDPYTLLIQAILARAVADAQGNTSPTRHLPQAALIAEARQWLADEDAVRDLVELCGYDANVVLRRIRRILQQPVPTVAQAQLALF